MIPQAGIIGWRRVASWPDDGMVEEGLVLSRALVEIFSGAALTQGVVLRGGTYDGLVAGLTGAKRSGRAANSRGRPP